MAAQKAGQKRKLVEIPRRDATFSQVDDPIGGVDKALDDGENEDDDSDYVRGNGMETNNGSKSVHAGMARGHSFSPGNLNISRSDTSRDLAPQSWTIKEHSLPNRGFGKDGEPTFNVTADANGEERFVYDEIRPDYDTDDSATATVNTIGNIPLSFYDAYPHIGYDINGRRISRPAKGEALDSLLDSIDLPEGWTGLTDPITGEPLNLSHDELETLKRLTHHDVADGAYDPYPDMIEYFTGKGMEEVMPLTAAPEPKRRFVPSAHEHRRVMKMVKAIRAGRIKPFGEPSKEEREREQQTQEHAIYDVWADEGPRNERIVSIPAPKLLPPGYGESYHPPPEYLPDQSEREEWERQDEEDRVLDFLPQDHNALRRVPGYAKFVKDKFERCLDLYLAPRVRRSKLNIDPESLLPKLPDPEDLKPFPTSNATVCHGHQGRVRSLAVDPTGAWVASGGDDGTVRVWDLKAGRQLWMIEISGDNAVSVVTWRPERETCILAACCGEDVHFMVPEGDLCTPDRRQASREVLDAGFGFAAEDLNADPQRQSTAKPAAALWQRPQGVLLSRGVILTLTLRVPAKSLCWHRRGDYFATVSPSSTSTATAVAIHTLSKHRTQHPFRRLKGLAQTACFHPSSPSLLVATRQRIRIYDLQQQKLEKELRPGAKWISAMSLHPLGSNLLVSSYDKRLLWHDLDLGTTPYKTLRYHSKAIRSVRFHPSLPLFADTSDDGTLQVFHGKVAGDNMENANVVPLKVLRGHKVVKELGVLDVDWHPREAWCVSAGADGTVRIWT